MVKLTKHTDLGSAVIIFITVVLFGVALFEKGMTQELLLEAGVFLVSVKLIVMSYKHSVATEQLHRQLEEIQISLRRIDERDRTIAVSERN